MCQDRLGLLSHPFRSYKVQELGLFLLKKELKLPGRAVAMLGHNYVRQAGFIGILFDLTVDEDDHIRVLFDGTRLSKVREDRPLIRPEFDGPRELGDGHQGNPQFAG